jgi:membrane protein
MPVRSRLIKIARRVDAFQQRHATLGFPVAVWKKLQDDKAGKLTALLTFYAFLSIFPLLLLLTTILGIVLRNYQGLQKQILNSALVDFPVIGQQLKTNIQGIGRGGVSLVVAIVLTLLGARGLAHTAQDAVNDLWDVPEDRRPGFPGSWLRSYGLISVVGLGVLATTVLSSIGSFAGGRTGFDLLISIVLLAASLVVNIGLFWLGLRLAAAPEVGWRDLRTGAVLAAVFWQALQWVGGFVVAHQLRHASSLYGVFGLVLGLIAWLFLQARLTLIVVASDVVRIKRLWPRSFL